MGFILSDALIGLMLISLGLVTYVEVHHQLQNQLMTKTERLDEVRAQYEHQMIEIKEE
ncbi:hypothetical protein FD04_GL002123 [Secundilactobacillus odoratitofui DSM 19909 = JCM 15043]|uniref:Uncharacterized protein n=1 Tax=Secundilactobacillus odoratitofui DSM 19909 = JCM 15043 TaxID=1423776 RepID=A0A0R1LN44_9LACO|nr:type II secretion system protein [Secundilactobacillus odoratitofui]KRK97261.1 hypothetical protein FD04_GL002123 [Secundilactobacillus odoratitofui DSM 19909 = JCM 15043]